ncbi:MAG: type 4a pilus biogenesis protein PilO [Deltaproteobacteria bacterium]|jgi:type IV pilus assembly protein PilO|nr:type 4a pilus biogenesis protein PilO [Deltaproteobacteria bacterium]
MEKGSFFESVGKIKMPIRILILVGTVVLIGGLFIWFVYIPKSEEITKVKQGIASLQRKLDHAKIRAKHLKKFEEELALVDGQFQEALRLLPNEKEIPQLLRTITQLGSDSQLEFRLFRPQREQTKDFFIVIPVSIEVSGSYHNVAVFFDRVGRMERIVNILNVSMKPVSSRSTTLITNCDAVTYSFKGPSDAKKTRKTRKK